jgi:arginase
MRESEIWNRKELYVVGYASGIAGMDPRTGEGPVLLRQSPEMAALADKGLSLRWTQMLYPGKHQDWSKTALVTELCESLANTTASLVRENRFFVVLGGDHTSAIGTFSGLAEARKSRGKPGLLWIDAHMDSHTPQTTHTGNLHGMPLACLLGHGEFSLTHLVSVFPVLDPAYVCLVGVRSHEQEEAALLDQLGVKVYFMDEVRKRGLDDVLAESKNIVAASPAGYGITIDIDSLDPEDAPATGVCEPGGIRAAALCHALKIFSDDIALAGIEISEFDPHLDREKRTERLIPEILSVIACHGDTDDSG